MWMFFTGEIIVHDLMVEFHRQAFTVYVDFCRNPSLCKRVFMFRPPSYGLTTSSAPELLRLFVTMVRGSSTVSPSPSVVWTSPYTVLDAHVTVWGSASTT